MWWREKLWEMSSKVVGFGQASMLNREIRWADIEEDDHVFLREDDDKIKVDPVKQQVEQLGELESDDFLESDSENIFLPLIKGKCSRAARRKQKTNILDDDIDEVLKEFGLEDSYRKTEEINIVNIGERPSISCKLYRNKVSREFAAESTARALCEMKSRNKKQKKKSPINNCYY